MSHVEEERVVEILVHTTASSRVADDLRYRAYATAYNDFVPARCLLFKKRENVGSGAESVARTEDAVQQDHESPALSTISTTEHRVTVFIKEPEDSSYVESQSQPPTRFARRMTRSLHRSVVADSTIISLPKSYLHAQTQSQPVHSPIFHGISPKDALGMSSGSVHMSFNSVYDNMNSPDFRTVPGFRATPPSGLWSQQEKSWKTPPEEVFDSMSTVDKTFAEFATPTRVLQVFLRNSNFDQDVGEKDTQQWEEEAKARDAEASTARDDRDILFNSRDSDVEILHHRDLNDPSHMVIPQSIDKGFANIEHGAISYIDKLDLRAAATVFNAHKRHGHQDSGADPSSISSTKTTILETPFPRNPRKSFLSRLHPSFDSPHEQPHIEETPTRAPPSTAGHSLQPNVEFMQQPVTRKTTELTTSTPHFTGIFPASSPSQGTNPILPTDPAPAPENPSSATTVTAKRRRRKKSRLDISTMDTVRPPLPKTDSLTLPLADTLVTPFMSSLTTQSIRTLGSRYNPLTQSRPLRDTERGYWYIPVSTWPEEIFTKAWGAIGKIIAGGSAGWGVWMERRKGEAEKGEEEKWAEWRIYCWGKVVQDVWLLVYSMSQRWIKVIGWSVWKDGEGLEVVIMGQGVGEKEKEKEQEKIATLEEQATK